jgi:hypothetical protein
VYESSAEVWWALHKCSHSRLVSLNPSVAITVLMLMDSVGARHEQVYMSAGAQAPETAPVWAARDLESESGKYDVVTCLDVMIHYPQVRFQYSTMYADEVGLDSPRPLICCNHCDLCSVLSCAIGSSL